MALESIEGVLLPNSAALVYTVPASTKVNFLRFGFVSIHTSDVVVTFHIVPNGGSVADTNKFSVTLSQNEHWEIECGQVLHAGDEIHWFADTASVIVGMLDYQEVPDTGSTIDSKAHTWDSTDAGYIPTAITQIVSIVQAGNYAVPSGKQLKIIHGLIHNKDTVPRGFGVFVVPSGATQNVKHLVQGAAAPFEVAAGETIEFSVKRFVTTGGKIHWHASAANALVGRISVEEFNPA